jgi:glycosyltransferase involved in cell wall biosynthesis
MQQNKCKLLCIDTTPVRRGAQVFVHDLSVSLMASGWDVKKVYLYQYPNTGKLDLNTDDVCLGGNSNHLFEKIPTIHPKLLLNLIKIVKEFKPTWILLNGSRTLKYGAWLKLMLKNSPILVYRVIDSAVYWNKRSFTQLYYKNWIIPSMDAAVGASAKSVHEMVSFYGFKGQNKPIPRAINAAHFEGFSSKSTCRAQLSLENDDFVLLFLGNLTVQKRPDRFVQIISLLQPIIPNLKAIMVGDGPLRHSTEEQIKSLSLTEVISCKGYQSDVRPFIGSSDVLVLTSDTEGMPGVVLEAAGMGIPSVSAQVGGVKEFIDDMETGITVKADAVDDYIKQILFLYNNPEKLKSIGASAKEKLVKNYGLDKITKDYILFLTSIAE